MYRTCTARKLQEIELDLMGKFVGPSLLKNGVALQCCGQCCSTQKMAEGKSAYSTVYNNVS